MKKAAGSTAVAAPSEEEVAGNVNLLRLAAAWSHDELPGLSSLLGCRAGRYVMWQSFRVEESQSYRVEASMMGCLIGGELRSGR